MRQAGEIGDKKCNKMSSTCDIDVARRRGLPAASGKREREMLAVGPKVSRFLWNNKLISAAHVVHNDAGIKLSASACAE